MRVWWSHGIVHAGLVLECWGCAHTLQPSSGILAMLDTKPTHLGYRIGVRMCWMQLKFHQQLMTAQIVKVEKVCQRSDFHVVDYRYVYMFVLEYLCGECYRGFHFCE